MKKKILLTVLILGAAAAVLFFLLLKEEKIHEEELAIASTSEIPALWITPVGEGRISAHDLPGPAILVLFNTDCDHCQRQAQAIAEHQEAFENYTLYFIASDAEDAIKEFSRTYGLQTMTNVTLARAEIPDVINTFGAISTPAIYIYSKERKLVKSFGGETPIEEMMKFL